MQKQKSKQRGITLIALVVTIIVLIILAGVSINMLVGDNGIITQAQIAKEENGRAEIIEKIQLEIADKQAENLGTIYEDEFYEILERYGTVSADETILTTYEGNYKITIADIYSGDIISIERKSNNLINIDELEYGVLLYGGNERTYAGAITTGYIETLDSQTTYLSNRFIQTISFYDENKSYVSFLNAVDGTSLANGFTIPENIKYIRISFKNDGMPNTISYDDFIADVWVGDKNCVSYEPYGEVNYRNSYPDTIENDRIFKNTMFYSATCMTYGK